MKYKLCDWEDNGYHDSYFYGVYFDTDDQDLHSISLGSTAYSGGYDFNGDYLLPTPEIAELARRRLVEHIFQAIKAAEIRDVMEPKDVKQGIWVRLLVAHNSRKAGIALQPGDRVRVNRCDAFGTFYANGYNHPGRHNRSIVGTLAGRLDKLIRVPLNKCRLDREPDTDEALRARAEELSHNHQYGAMFGCKAWLSNNWALVAAQEPVAA